MRRRIARLAGVFTLAALVGCGQTTASNVNLSPAGQRAVAVGATPAVAARAASHARLAGPTATAASPAGKAWWQQLLDAPRKAGARNGEQDLGRWWRDVTSDFARQLRQSSSGRSAPKLPHSG